MAQDSFSATTKILLNSKILQPPKEWQEIGLIASFQDGEVQPTITQENLTFILDSYTELKNGLLIKIQYPLLKLKKKFTFF